MTYTQNPKTSHMIYLVLFDGENINPIVADLTCLLKSTLFRFHII